MRGVHKHPHPPQWAPTPVPPSQNSFFLKCCSVKYPYFSLLFLSPRGFGGAHSSSWTSASSLTSPDTLKSPKMAFHSLFPPNPSQLGIFFFFLLTNTTRIVAAFSLRSSPHTT
eukprot:Hpha_TRINITY_DN16089_c5_g2::TRINITY_DN16089_c5_g2_i4::g.119508::m.119508